MPPAHRAPALDHSERPAAILCELVSINTHLRGLELALEREARSLRRRVPVPSTASFLERFGNEAEDIARDAQRVGSQLAAVRSELKKIRAHICFANEDFLLWWENNPQFAQQLLALRNSQLADVSHEVLPPHAVPPPSEVPL